MIVTDHMIEVVTDLNKLVQAHFAKMSGDDYNTLIQLLESKQLILGGDSACFHILDHDSPVVNDCNPDAYWFESIDSLTQHQ